MLEYFSYHPNIKDVKLQRTIARTNCLWSWLVFQSRTRIGIMATTVITKVTNGGMFGRT